MIFEEREKRTGKKFIVGSKYWPDGSRFRRRFSKRTLAKNVLGRIEGAIAMGTWKELRKELAGQDEQQDYTIREFADLYFEEYCKIRNTRPDFKEERLNTIKDILGNVSLREFTNADAAYFEKERAKSLNPRTGQPISKATINRGLAVLSHMFTFALKKRSITAHPMTRYGRLRENEKALRVMTLDACPFVFVWPETKRPVRDPRHSFFEGRAKAKLPCGRIFDLRHFRATQWIMRGVDIRSVQGLLGHRNIKTTERYVKFVPVHASQRDRGATSGGYGNGCLE